MSNVIFVLTQDLYCDDGHLHGGPHIVLTISPPSLSERKPQVWAREISGRNRLYRFLACLDALETCRVDWRANRSSAWVIADLEVDKVPGPSDQSLLSASGRSLMVKCPISKDCPKSFVFQLERRPGAVKS
ncbi:hypothetical protein ElyMa_006763800 [Elysia marginata]|uniref:Uncharacterized protein n=1 Tax=Elysia marginata TaxID=1093978 RepID=A0AAV4J1H5_9GAST|nr:hypothetical protein ElyMa_006763800 [Elysia marginata]